jgi:hypothetical protein
MIYRGLGWMFLGLGAAAACGGSVSGIGGPDGGGRDAMPHTGADANGQDVKTLPDASSDTSVGEAMSTHPYDGTTGKPCTTDADCASPGGPGLARCSSSVFAPDAYYPTAVCILPSCSPVSDTSVHYCDGPDDPTSPGM